MLIAIVFSRGYFINEESTDYLVSLLPWSEFIRTHGVLGAFKEEFSNYAPLYLHIISLGVLFNCKTLYFLKSVDFIFEAVAAIFIFKIIRKKYSFVQAIYAAGTFLLIPTVVLNGARWAQCDIIYTAMLIVSLYYFLENNFFRTMIFAGLAYAFKQQAIFVFPFLLLVVMRDRTKIKYLLLLPLPFLLSVLPSIFAGRNVLQALSVYFNQDREFTNVISINAPTVYNFFTVDEEHFIYYKTAGILLTASLVLVVLFFAAWRQMDVKANAVRILLLLAILVPFFLPRMHERYFMIAECFSILYVFYYRQHYLLPLLVIVPSLATYLHYFGTDHFIPLTFCSLLMMTALLVVGFSLIKESRKKSGAEKITV